MSGVGRISRRLIPAAVVALLALAIVAPGAAPVSAATSSVRFEAGPHPAVRFDSAWHVVASRTATLNRPSSAPWDRRVSVPGQGVHLRITAGLFAGWWVPEGRLTYVPGVVGLRTYAPAVPVAFPAATYEAYRFDPAGRLLEARGRALSRSSSAPADRTAIIDGRPYLHVAAGIWAGWWIPGRVSGPEPIRCASGPKPTPTAPRIVRSVSTATGRVALTFDMGGRLEPAVAIVRFLVLERVCATIFPTGAAAETATGRAVIAEVRAHPELFEVGNHTRHHCNLRDGGGGAACPAKRPDAAFVGQELAAAEAVVAALAGRTTVPYWRPPYGAVDGALSAIAAGAGYPATIMWSTDTIDWRPVANGGPTAWGISSRILTGERPGAIVLMHLGGWNTLDSLPATIDGLLRDGYRATTISGLYR